MKLIWSYGAVWKVLEIEVENIRLRVRIPVMKIIASIVFEDFLNLLDVFFVFSQGCSMKQVHGE
jgi:hypothetical protein